METYNVKVNFNSNTICFVADCYRDGAMITYEKGNTAEEAVLKLYSKLMGVIKNFELIVRKGNEPKVERMLYQSEVN